MSGNAEVSDTIGYDTAVDGKSICSYLFDFYVCFCVVTSASFTVIKIIHLTYSVRQLAINVTRVMFLVNPVDFVFLSNGIYNVNSYATW